MALAFGCKPQNKNLPNLYFSLSDLAKQEVVHLNKNKPEVIKISILNGQADTAQSKDLNWEKQLLALEEADINKVAWRNQYKVVKDKNTTTYTALKKELKIKKLVVTSNNLKPLVEAWTVSDNFLYHTESKLVYQRDSIYELFGYQKLFTGKKVEFDVKILF
jgi:hypothetical protein